MHVQRSNRALGISVRVAFDRPVTVAGPVTVYRYSYPAHPFVQPARSVLAIAGLIPRREHWSAANAPGIAPIPDAWGLGRHIDTQSPWHRQPRLTHGVLCVSNAPNAPSVFGHALPGDLETSLRQPEPRAPGAGHRNDPNNPEKREHEKQDRAVGDGYGHR
jgi:hypothetical protein